MPRKLPPVESFGNELLSTLIEASKRRITLNFTQDLGGYASATKFQQRIYMLRSSMLSAKHPLAAAVAKVTSKMSWGCEIGDPEVELVHNARNVPRPKFNRTKVRLELFPADDEFRSVVLAAGIEQDMLDRDILAETSLEPPADPAVEDNGDDILTRIERTKQ